MRVRRTVLATLFSAVLVAPATLIASPVAAGGFCRGEAVTTAKGQVVEMKGNCFTPTVLHASPGQAVMFVNRDAEAHTVTGAGDWGTGHKEIAQGDAVRIRLKEPGLYLYSCLLHPGMMGAVYVDAGRSIAVADGSRTSVPSIADLEAEALAGSGSSAAEELQAEQAAATEAATSPPAGAIIGLGIAVLGAGFGLGWLRRRTPERRPG